MRTHLTEKSVQLANQDKPVFTFVVGKNVTTDQIKKRLKEEYKVDAVDVRFINNVGKVVRFRNRKGYRSAIRKAIIQLKPKQRINDFDVKEEKPAKE